MGIPAGVSHWTLEGSMPGGDIWVSGFWTDWHATSQADANSNTEAVWAKWKDVTAGTVGNILQSHFFSRTTTLDRLASYSYLDGSGKATYIGQSSSAGWTGTGNSNLPDPTCIVATLQTPMAGRSHKGRMYLPCTGANTDGGGLVPDPDPLNLATALAATLKSSAATLGAFFPVVLSRKLGTFVTINSVAVDQRPDVQRRRANRQNKGARHVVSISYP